MIHLDPDTPGSPDLEGRPPVHADMSPVNEEGSPDLEGMSPVHEEGSPDHDGPEKDLPSSPLECNNKLIMSEPRNTM